MRTASLRGDGLSQNNIFNQDNPANRDDCFAPYVLLRKVFLERGVTLNTLDVNALRKTDLELHQDVKLTSDAPFNYLLMFETPLVFPNNGDSLNWSPYRKIFTWRDDLVDGVRFIKINFPNPIITPQVDGWFNRNNFCCLIAGNKSLTVNDARGLYKERTKAIRWFEKNAPNDFDLYGVGWDVPAFGNNLISKVMRRLCHVVKPIIKWNPFPSYRGKVNHKRDVLLRARFSICYENVRDFPGYITEKIFDSFFSGCVPVYWGANNVTDYIPADCFIDRRQFRDTEAVYKYLKMMTEDEFVGYQRRIAEFLASDAAKPFGSEAFAETIVSTIVQDLES